MSTLYRQCDSRYAFLWASARQPEGRWHAPGDGPVQYLADSPDGAWAELLRHEEIREVDDVDGIARALWAVELADVPEARPNLDDATVRAIKTRMPRAELKPSGFVMLGRGWSPSRRRCAAAGRPWRGGRRGQCLGGPTPCERGALGPPDLDGWLMVDGGALPSHVLTHVRYFES
jgi:hypothetical protein